MSSARGQGVTGSWAPEVGDRNLQGYRPGPRRRARPVSPVRSRRPDDPLRSAGMADPRVYRQMRFQPPPGATEVLLVRHGESEPAIEGQDFELVDGQGNPALSPEGREQAELVGQRLAGERIDAIYVSSL